MRYVVLPSKYMTERLQDQVSTVVEGKTSATVSVKVIARS